VCQTKLSPSLHSYRAQHGAAGPGGGVVGGWAGSSTPRTPRPRARGRAAAAGPPGGARTRASARLAGPGAARRAAPAAIVARAAAGRPAAPRCARWRERRRPPCLFPTPAGDSYDVVLSSGFLAFANHSGFLQAVEEVRRAAGGARALAAEAPAPGAARARARRGPRPVPRLCAPARQPRQLERRMANWPQPLPSACSGSAPAAGRRCPARRQQP
jgi:hypothetical protein